MLGLSPIWVALIIFTVDALRASRAYRASALSGPGNRYDPASCRLKTYRASSSHQIRIKHSPALNTVMPAATRLRGITYIAFTL